MVSERTGLCHAEPWCDCFWFFSCLSTVRKHANVEIDIAMWFQCAWKNACRCHRSMGHIFRSSCVGSRRFTLLPKACLTHPFVDPSPPPPKQRWSFEQISRDPPPKPLSWFFDSLALVAHDRTKSAQIRTRSSWTNSPNNLWVLQLQWIKIDPILIQNLECHELVIYWLRLVHERQQLENASKSHERKNLSCSRTCCSSTCHHSKSQNRHFVFAKNCSIHAAGIYRAWWKFPEIKSRNRTSIKSFTLGIQCVKSTHHDVRNSLNNFATSISWSTTCRKRNHLEWTYFSCAVNWTVCFFVYYESLVSIIMEQTDDEMKWNNVAVGQSNEHKLNAQKLTEFEIDNWTKGSSHVHTYFLTLSPPISTCLKQSKSVCVDAIRPLTPRQRGSTLSLHHDDPKRFLEVRVAAPSLRPRRVRHELLGGCSLPWRRYTA